MLLTGWRRRWDGAFRRRALCLLFVVLLGGCPSPTRPGRSSTPASRSGETQPTLQCEGREACADLAERLLQRSGALSNPQPLSDVDSSAEASFAEPDGPYLRAPASVGPQALTVSVDPDDAAEDAASAAPECVFASTPGVTAPISRSSDKEPETLIGNIYRRELQHLASYWEDGSPRVWENRSLSHAFQYFPAEHEPDGVAAFRIHPELARQQLAFTESDWARWTNAVAGNAAHEMGHHQFRSSSKAFLRSLLMTPWPNVRREVAVSPRLELYADAAAGCALARTWGDTQPLEQFFAKFAASNSHPAPELRVRAIAAGVGCTGATLDDERLRVLRNLLEAWQR